MTSTPPPASTPPPEPEQEQSSQPQLLFRNVCPTDLARIYALEKASYPPDEAASRSQLQYRQHHAASFFRCAVLLDQPLPNIATNDKVNIENGSVVSSIDNSGSAGTSATTGSGTSNAVPVAISTVVEDNRNSLNGMGQIIGYVAGTRCHTFDEESMKSHDPSGKLLAIHSVVVEKKHRKKGIGTQIMANYLKAVEQIRQSQSVKLKYPIEKVVLITKMNNVGFYLRSGFGVLGKSKIDHGKEDWYDCEMLLENREDDIVEKTKTYECWIMDSFAMTNTGGMVGISPICTSGKGTGNPAGVVLITDGGQLNTDDDEEFDPTFEDNREWMKTVAREFNLSETAFIWEKKISEGLIYGIRYFTSNGTEVDLCGHATLAASSVVCEKLAEQGKRDVSVLFHANNDVLKAKPAANGSGSQGSSKIIMEFPSKQTIPLEAGSDTEIAAKKMIKDTLFSSMTDDDFESALCQVGLDDGGDDLLVEVKTDAFLSMPRAADVDFTSMKTFDGYNRGVIVCCLVSEELKEHGERADFLSRFFGPKVGINEDPVTGSAHCVLGPYFGKKLEKDFIIGAQKSERGGIIECTLLEEGGIKITGTVTKAMSGTLFL